jgi:hypothetical protein
MAAPACRLLSVVSGGVSGPTRSASNSEARRVAATFKSANLFIAPSTDYYLRYYMKNDDTSSAGDHIVTVDTYQ